MDSEPRPKVLWHTASLALWGASLGAFAAVLHHFSHAFWGEIPEGDPFMHLLTEVATYALAGASVFAGVAVLRHWLSRDT